MCIRVRPLNQLDPDVQKLYIALADELEKWAKENNRNNQKGLVAIYEVLSLLLVSVKAFYAMTYGKDKNEVRTQSGQGNAGVSDDAAGQAGTNS